MEKTSTTYVQSALVKCLLTTRIFNLWMSKGACNVFATVGFFSPLVGNPNMSLLGCLRPIICMGLPWLWKRSLTNKIVAYIKDKGSNLQTCAMAFNSIVLCDDLDMVEPFDDFCFSHAILKLCQYATFDDKVSCKFFGWLAMGIILHVHILMDLFIWVFFFHAYFSFQKYFVTI